MSKKRPDSADKGSTATDDARLVRETLAGNNFAFDELVERYQGKIYNLALGITANSQDARDAAQNAFLKAYQSLSGFDPTYKFFSWIYRIGFNEALNIVNRRRNVVALETETATTAAGPDRQATSNETGRAIRQALGELSPDLRATIVLRHFHGLSYREMSEVIGVSVGRVKSRLFSARSKLRRSLSQRGLAPGHEP